MKRQSIINYQFSPTSDDKDNGEDTHPINCNYYNIDEFTKAEFNSSKSFSVLHLNIHSIKKIYWGTENNSKLTQL